MKKITDCLAFALILLSPTLSLADQADRAVAPSPHYKVLDPSAQVSWPEVSPKATDLAGLELLAAANSSPTERTADGSSLKPRANFRVFNAMLYQQMPAFGERMAVVYEQTFFPGKREREDRTPLDEGLQAAADQVEAMSGPPYNARADLIVIDIERYKVWPFVRDEPYRSSMQKYAQIAQRFRKFSERPFCFYGAFPTGGPVWTGWVDKKRGVREQWDAAREVAEQTLVPHVDAICPSLYTFYGSPDAVKRRADIAGWQTFARVSIAQARRAAPGKPVYAFIWPKYHNAGNRPGSPYVEDDIWRAQIELLKSLADGIVLWGGFQQKWDPKAQWWQTLQELTGVRAGNSP